MYFFVREPWSFPFHSKIPPQLRQTLSPPLNLSHHRHGPPLTTDSRSFLARAWKYRSIWRCTLAETFFLLFFGIWGIVYVDQASVFVLLPIHNHIFHMLISCDGTNSLYYITLPDQLLFSYGDTNYTLMQALKCELLSLYEYGKLDPLRRDLCLKYNNQRCFCDIFTS